jgi:hypothetical protein
MILDKEMSFCLNKAVPTGATQAATFFGDIIDLWGAGVVPTPPTGGPLTNLRDVWAGNHPEVFVQVGTTIAQASGSITLELVTGDTSAGTDITTSLLVLATTGALTISASVGVSGYRFRFPPVFSVPLGRQRYLGLRLTITTTAVTAGTITGGLVWTTTDSPNTFV